MNNYFSSLICIMVLAFAPACFKKKKHVLEHSQNEVTVKVEVQTSSPEESGESVKSIAKF